AIDNYVMGRKPEPEPEPAKNES
ncbi:hypothetical protein LCGC14_2988270, partial [marine sediment metagenome]